MKNITVPIQNNAKNEGYTEAELRGKVRLRAFEIYRQRGGVNGHALDDWAQAEAEILRPKHRSAAA